MSNEVIRIISHSKRLQLVASIQSTIPREMIRVQLVQERLRRMWGIVWLNKLPFIFQAWPSMVIHEQLEFISNGLKAITDWGFVLAPQHPLDFEPPIMTVPLREGDMHYMLNGLKVGDQRIVEARTTENLTQLFEEILTERKPNYRRYLDLYFRDKNKRLAYGTAVSIACDEKAAGLLR